MISSGRPLIRTRTTGLPVATAASSNCCCWPGSVRVEREAFSPFMFWASPRTTTATSDVRTRSMARLNSVSFSASVLMVAGGSGKIGSKMDGVVRCISTPFAVRMAASAPSLLRSPSRIVTESLGWPARLQEPMMSTLESARGPMTAMEPGERLSGSRASSLRKRTAVCWAVLRVASRWLASSAAGSDFRNLV